MLDALGSMQGERHGCEEDEELLQADEEHGQIAGGGQEPPACCNKARNAIECKMDRQTRHMTDELDRMCTMQPQRMDSLENRLEMEARRAAAALKDLDTKVTAESSARVADIGLSTESVKVSRANGARGEHGHRAMLFLGDGSRALPGARLVWWRENAVDINQMICVNNASSPARQNSSGRSRS